MNVSYLELEISFKEDNVDSIYNHLYFNGINTILEENGVIKVYLSEDNLALAEKIKKDLLSSLNISPSHFRLAKFENHNWNRVWEKSIEPVYIKEKFIIYP
jgi:hypothetical protein